MNSLIRQRARAVLTTVLAEDAPAPISPQGLHAAATLHADEWARQSFEFRKQNRMEPYDLYSANRELWLQRYEGFKGGVAWLRTQQFYAQRAQRASHGNDNKSP